jgi:hypothetical protein
MISVKPFSPLDDLAAMDYGDFDITTYDLGTLRLSSIGGSRGASPVDRSQLQ